jgi:hypothetical protein
MPAFDYSRNLTLNTALCGSGAILSTQYQIALLVVQGDPDDTNTTLIAKEPSGYNYTRITTSAGVWTYPTSGYLNAQPAGHGVVQNNTPLSFPQASGSWGTVIGTAVLTTLSGSATYNPLFYGAVRPELVVGAGSLPVTFGVGAYHVETKGFSFADSARDQTMLGYFGGMGKNHYPSTYYLGLLNELPESCGLGYDAEIQTVGTNGYARVVISNDGSFSVATTGISYNTVPFTFVQPTGTWGTLPAVAWAMFDTAMEGTMWFYGPLEPAIPPLTSTSLPPTINNGQLQISLDALR